MTSYQNCKVMGFPVFCLAFTPGKCRVLIGGGGGATKAGVKNAAILYELNEQNGTLTLLAEEVFSKQEDGCMSIALHPIEKITLLSVNSSEDIIKKGNNLNCRIYTLEKERLNHIKSIQTISSVDPFYHQKAVEFSPKGDLLLTGTTEGKFTVWNWPELTCSFPSLEPGNEIYDAHFDHSGAKVVVITANKCMILHSQSGKLEWMSETPLVYGIPCEFRAARFVGLDLYVICNAKSRKGSFMCIYSKSKTDGWDLGKCKKISQKPITAFTINNDGELLAFGSADLSIQVLLTSSLGVILKIEKAHGFPVTAIAFSNSSKCIVSGSADGTCLISSIPSRDSNSHYSYLSFVIFVLMILVIIILTIPLDNQDEMMIKQEL